MLDSQFDPEKQIPETLWRFIERAGQNEETWAEILSKMSRTKLLELFEAYVAARAELVDAANQNRWIPGASEDVIEDACDAVVASGKAVYLEVYRGEKSLEGFRDGAGAMLHVIESVYYDRFDESPFEMSD